MIARAAHAPQADGAPIPARRRAAASSGALKTRSAAESPDSTANDELPLWQLVQLSAKMVD